jgi:hypothetical protein
LSTESGYRRLPARVTCSEPLISNTGRSRTTPCTRPHSPIPIQCRHPEWTARGDADPDAARTTRRALLVAAAATNALVLGTHFTGTAAGRVLSTDQGYRLFVPQA